MIIYESYNDLKGHSNFLVTTPTWSYHTYMEWQHLFSVVTTVKVKLIMKSQITYKSHNNFIM